MDILFNKLYKNNRRVNSYIAIPYAKGARFKENSLILHQNNTAIPSQEKITATYPDGSVKFSFIRFICDLPANSKASVQCDIADGIVEPISTGLSLEHIGNSYTLTNNELSVGLSDYSTSLFSFVKTDSVTYDSSQFVGPIFKDSDNQLHSIKLGHWTVIEEGNVLIRLKAQGVFTDCPISFECNVSLAADSSMVDIAFRIINSCDSLTHIKALWFAVLGRPCSDATFLGDLSSTLNMEHYSNTMKPDSTGCSDAKSTVETNSIIQTTGTAELTSISEKIVGTRTCVATSNYKTNFTFGNNGYPVDCLVDADYLIGEANEHFAEVFYGTFFADRTDSKGGVCGTIFQAQQNFPKAVRADDNGIYIMLVPEGSEKIEMSSGMSREQRFSLLFHDKDMPMEQIDDISIRYQMPDRPYLAPEVFKNANIFPDIFTSPDTWDEDVEIALVGKCDAHGRAYGMLNWGDAPDMNYTTQGRGNGLLVWSNNEYDYPHACALQYIRTGERRFLDYCITAVKHWMDVDVCHFSSNPLYIDGQWEHTARHNKDGVMVCSHEWVEGLLDYYHLTGDERGLETALGIGDNVRRLLDTPFYQTPGEANARETGWALRSLTALYVETSDEKYIEKCQWIVDQFKVWKDNYGEWIAPYTDNTLIRTGFMISVALGSLMRYYRVFPSQELKQMMLDSIDDLIDNATLPYGLFYYKELPSLNRLGTNTLLLEALAIGYELTGDKNYLIPGMRTFKREISSPASGPGGAKKHVEDAVLSGNTSPKGFAQQFIPLTTYYTALIKENMI